MTKIEILLLPTWEMVDFIHELTHKESELLKDENNFLTLTFTGDDWAATFGALFDDDEWFEPDNESWPLVAHGKTVGEAIHKAAELVLI